MMFVSGRIQRPKCSVSRRMGISFVHSLLLNSPQTQEVLHFSQTQHIILTGAEMSLVDKGLKLLQTRKDAKTMLLCSGYSRSNSPADCPSDVVLVIAVFSMCFDKWYAERKGKNILISGVNEDVITTSVEGYQSAYSHNRVKSGDHEWTLKILKYVRNTLGSSAWWRLAVGIVDASTSVTESYFSCGKYEWVCISAPNYTGSDETAHLGTGSGSNTYGRVCKDGDVIGIHLHLYGNGGKLSFSINGENQGNAFTIKNKKAEKEYRMAVSLTGTGTSLQLVSYEGIPCQ